MTQAKDYYVALFKSVSHALRAEKLLKEKEIPYKLIPVPRHISSDCGVCLRFESVYKKEIEAALFGKVDVNEIRQLGRSF